MRSTYWDSIKGLAIIAVVIIHSSGSAFTFFPEGSLNWIFGVTLRQITAFAVPIFFVVSGLFSQPRKGLSARSFIVNRFIRILPPYILWSLVSLVLNKPHLFLNPMLLVRVCILGGGIAAGYFVIVLLQFILLTPLIWKIKTAQTHIAIMITFSILGLSATYVLRILGSPYYFILFIFWYPFFHFGVFTSMFKRDMEIWLHKIRKFIPGLLIICFALALIEGFFWSSHGFVSIGKSQLKISSFLFSFILFLAILSFKEIFSRADRVVIAWLGRASFIIYLSHMLVLNRVRHVLISFSFKQINMLFQLQPVFILLVSLCTVIVCALLILSIEHTPVRRVKKYLGL